MQVGRDTVVSLKIQMYDAQGALLHAPEDEHVYLHGGYGGLLDALERSLEGKRPGESVRVLRASVADAQGAAPPGTVLGLADDGLRVACGEGVLALQELQRAGKRPVAARDFANAVRIAGLRFGS